MSRFVFAGNEIIPGTVVMTADGTITPKDDLRVILNILGGGNVTLPDGTDTTQRIEIVNVNADPCSFTYKGTGGSTTASIYTNTGIRLLWVGSYWETSMSTAVTGIDDNSQPFAFNIDSLVKPDGVINLTGTDADGNPFDYGVGKLVTVADEDNLITGVEVKTSKTFNGKPVYKKSFRADVNIINSTYDFNNALNDVENIISFDGSAKLDTGSGILWMSINRPSKFGLDFMVDVYYNQTSNFLQVTVGQGYAGWAYKQFIVEVEYTKTTD